MALPASVTLPFGCFEEALKDKENKGTKNKLEAAVADAQKGGSAPAAALAECRAAVEVWQSLSLPGCAGILVAALLHGEV